MLSCQYGSKSLRNVSNTLLNQCHEELRQFTRQKWVQPSTSKVYLIKWPVSVYVTGLEPPFSCMGGGRSQLLVRLFEIRGVRFYLHSTYSLASVTHTHTHTHTHIYIYISISDILGEMEIYQIKALSELFLLPKGHK